MPKLAAASLVFLASMIPAVVAAQTSTADAVAQIDTECNATLSAVSQTSPVNVILRGKQWAVLSDAQLQSVAGYGNPGQVTPHYAGVYKEDGRYVYVREVSFDQSSQQHSLGLCFRSDGTLERARQAQTIPGLSSETAERAYYAADGTLIQKTPGFNDKDPTIARNVKDLRYFSVLPQP